MPACAKASHACLKGTKTATQPASVKVPMYMYEECHKKKLQSLQKGKACKKVKRQSCLSVIVFVLEVGRR